MQCTRVLKFADVRLRAEGLQSERDRMPARFGPLLTIVVVEWSVGSTLTTTLSAVYLPTEIMTRIGDSSIHAYIDTS